MATKTADPTEATEAEAVAPEAEAEGVKRGRGSVKYFGKGLEGAAAASLDELPAEPPRAVRTGSSQYFEMLSAIGDDESRIGKWTPIAQFGTPGGAKAIATQLNKQVAGHVNVEGQEKVRGYLDPQTLRRIPEYDGWTWVFDSRRTTLDDGSEGSTLYAKIVEAAEASA